MPRNLHLRSLEGLGAGNGPCLLDLRLKAARRTRLREDETRPNVERVTPSKLDLLKLNRIRGTVISKSRFILNLVLVALFAFPAPMFSGKQRSHPPQKAFMNALEHKVNLAFSSRLDGPFQAANYPAGFFWGVQFGPHNYYNQSFLQQVDLRVEVGSDGLLTLADTQFSELYYRILDNVAFQFSPSDRRILERWEATAKPQIQELINAWERSIGTITPADIKESNAFPPTKLGYIEFNVQTRWQGDLEGIRQMLPEFTSAYQYYQIAFKEVAQLMATSAKAIQRINAARANTLKPSASNGGLQTGTSSFHLAYGPFPTQSSIIGGLLTESDEVTINVRLDNFGSRSTHVSVEGSVAVSTPILDVMSFGIGDSASFDLSRYTLPSTTLDMTIVYPGVTVVAAPYQRSNLSTDNTVGWFDNQILAEAVAGKTSGRTGYVLQGKQFPIDEYFGVGKKFARIKTFVISRQPTFKMKFCGAETSQITSDFKELSSASLSFLGFPVGSVPESYEVKKVDDKSVADCVTVEMGPSKVVGGPPSSDGVAYIMGGVPSYPPNYY